jgi:LysR family transcriptional activator of glutamate synthase operon
MTPDQLRYFLTVEKHLNISDAAEKLHLSQSSLSRQIQKLEDDVGVRLFDRTTRKISLTAAGTDFSFFARQILDLHKQLHGAMREHSPACKNRIVLHSVPVMSIYELPTMIAAFNERSPDISFDIIEGDTLAVLESLRNGRADLAFVNTNYLPETEFLTVPLISDEMVLIVQKNNRLAGRNTISLAETSQENFLFLGVETNAYDFCFEACRHAGFEPKVVNTRQTSMQLETILDFVSSGRGVSIVNAKAAEYYWKRNIRIVRLEEKIPIKMGFALRNEPVPASAGLLWILPGTISGLRRSIPNANRQVETLHLHNFKAACLKKTVGDTMSYPQKEYTATEKNDLLAHLASCRSAREKKRLLCLKLRVIDGKHAKDIAALTGYATSTVEDLISTYHTGGLKPFLYKKHAGNHRKLTQDQERQLLHPFLEAAREGKVPSVEEIQRAYEKWSGQK